MIWVVSGGYDHEGSEVLGVFSTEEKAHAFVAEQLSEKRPALDLLLSHDYLEIRGCVLDGPLDGRSVVFDKRDAKRQLREDTE
jgi:hypothetical protein